MALNETDAGSMGWPTREGPARCGLGDKRPSVGGSRSVVTPKESKAAPLLWRERLCATKPVRLSGASNFGVWGEEWAALLFYHSGCSARWIKMTRFSRNGPDQPGEWLLGGKSVGWSARWRLAQKSDSRRDRLETGAGSRRRFDGGGSFQGHPRGRQRRSRR